MNLLDIRKKFIQLSGRFDLVVDNESYEDDGADWFIQSGQRMLDRLAPTHKDDAMLRDVVTPQKNFIEISMNRSVRNVWVLPNNSLIKLGIENFSKRFGVDGKMFSGQPKYYTVRILRDTETDDEITKSYQSVLVAPKPQENHRVRVEGLFLSTRLTEDCSESYWSLNHPDTLVQAALYSLERFHRNTQGMRDHLEAINLDVRGIYNDTIRQEMAGRDDLDDSFKHGRRSNYGV